MDISPLQRSISQAFEQSQDGVTLSTQDCRVLLENASDADIHDTLTWALSQQITPQAVTYEFLVMFDSDLDSLIEAIMECKDYPVVLQDALSDTTHPSAWAAVGRAMSKHINVKQGNEIIPTSYDWNLLLQCIQTMNVDDLARCALTFSSHPQAMSDMVMRVFDQGSDNDIEEMMSHLEAVFAVPLNHHEDEESLAAVEEIASYKSHPQYWRFAQLVFHNLNVHTNNTPRPKTKAMIQRIFNDIDSLVVDRLIEDHSTAKRMDAILPYLNEDTQKMVSHHHAMNNMPYSNTIVIHDRLNQEVGSLGTGTPKSKL